MALKQAFKQALEFEKKGQKLYTEFAKKTKNPVVARTFKYLAEQELLHIKIISEYIKEAKLEFNYGEDVVGETNDFFATTVRDFKKKLELSKDDVLAHETALHLEKNAYNFYKKELDGTGDDDMRRFFEFMMKQEKIHYALIEKTYDFIKDPQGFFLEQEKWFFEG